MIITKIMGGLGNQLFQYACGRFLAERNKTILKLDIFEYSIHKFRKYQLNNFNIIENYATIDEIIELAGNEQKCFIENKYYKFDPSILNFGSDLYLWGFWQTEKYFKQIEDIIKEEFTLKIPITQKHRQLVDLISDKKSISIHIRRGDYVGNEHVGDICTLDYYDKAIKYIVKKVPDPYFFVFSDEPEWVKSNFRIPYRMTIVANSKEDLSLMSLCKHNIIANSSFSWWGAWLNANADKIVIAPNRWHNVYTDSDIICDNWLKI